MGKHTLHEPEDVTAAVTGRHADTRTDAVPVAELLDEARREGRPVRLTWPVGDQNELVPEQLPGQS